MIINRTIVFIHGGRVTPACWEPFVSFFESKGNRCLAPTWPGKDRSVEAIRADPSPLAGLGIGEIVDHYDRIVRSLGEPPILIGDSIAGEADRAMPRPSCTGCPAPTAPRPPGRTSLVPRPDPLAHRPGWLGRSGPGLPGLD